MASKNLSTTVPFLVSPKADTATPGPMPFTDTALSGVLHLDGFAPAGVPFKLAMPRAVLPKDLSAVQISEFALGFGGFATVVMTRTTA